MDHFSTDRLRCDNSDMRCVSLRNAVIGEFDARGKMLTLEFLEGARFDKLQYDDTTQIYDDEGNKIERFQVIRDKNSGYSFFMAL